MPISYAMSITSLPGDGAIEQFKTSLYPMLMRLWRREELRRRPSLSGGLDEAARMQARAIAETSGNEYTQTVHITVNAEDAQRVFSMSDPDRWVLDVFEEDPDLRQQRERRWAALQEMLDNKEPLLPEDLRGSGVLHYVARRRTRRTDINRALWGNKIELWCKEDEFCARHKPGYDDDEHDRDSDHH